MKRIASILILMAVMLGEALAQTPRYLVNVASPVNSMMYTPYKYNGPSSKKLEMQGGMTWYGGFVLKTSHLPTTPGWATFKLGGQYDKLMFSMAMHPGTFGDDSACIVTVTADGRKILDKALHYYDLPERFTLDISGADEVKFAIIAGDADVSFGEVTLWKAGETPVAKTNLPSAPKTAMLVRDIKPYASYKHIMVSPDSDRKSVSVNGKEYNYGIFCNMEMALIGENPGATFFDLNGQYETLSLLLGPVDMYGRSGGEGWLTVEADGKPLYEFEVSRTDIARRVVLDVTGCRQLAIRSAQTSTNMYGAVVDALVYPPGEYRKVDGQEVTEEIDPRLKKLPDVCKLISNIRPYAMGGNISKQLYDGASEHLTFSMGGVRFSEGFILHEQADFFHDELSSYAAFDLGREFDYVSFTAGYVGKSWYMNNDYIRVYADDELVFQTPILATFPNQSFVVPIKKCRRLRFENGGSGNLSVAAFGIADIVVYRGDPVENNLFVHPRPDCPDEIELIDLGRPYIHYVSTKSEERDQILYDGTTARRYFPMPDGSRINKGFILQTSSHFSLDQGIFAEGEGTKAAASAVIGGAAVGSAFVAAGAVGGAVIGSTLIGAAAFLMLAAGGTAVENSCAAFNTYGEYNSVTFTVACQQPFSAGSDYKETLLIGADQEVVAELTVYETMEPQTVTVPINGCGQLMFWLANTDGTSAKYVFYDIKLSKEHKALSIPKGARLSKAVVTEPNHTPKTLEVKWENPSFTNSQGVNAYLTACNKLNSDVRKLLEDTVPGYKIYTTYLETADGQVCKAVSLKDGNDNYLRIPERYSRCADEVKRLRKLKADLIDISIGYVSANLALPELGLGALSYAKVLKTGKSLTAECKTLAEAMLAEKTAELAVLEDLISSGSSFDGVKSTTYTLLCPIGAGDVVPDDQQLQQLKHFTVK